MFGKEHDEIYWINVFQFQSAHSYRESVFWNKYATEQEVHELGLEKAARKAGHVYAGCLEGNVGQLRAKQLGRCQGSFEVHHEPSEGQAHCEIEFLLPPGQKLNKLDKRERESILRQVFSKRIEY